MKTQTFYMHATATPGKGTAEYCLFRSFASALMAIKRPEDLIFTLADPTTDKRDPHELIAECNAMEITDPRVTTCFCHYPPTLVLQ